MTIKRGDQTITPDRLDIPKPAFSFGGEIQSDLSINKWVREDAMLEDKRLLIKVQLNVAQNPASSQSNFFVLSLTVFEKYAAAIKRRFNQVSLLRPQLKRFDNIFLTISSSCAVLSIFVFSFVQAENAWEWTPALRGADARYQVMA